MFREILICETNFKTLVSKRKSPIFYNTCHHFAILLSQARSVGTIASLIYQLITDKVTDQ